MIEVLKLVFSFIADLFKPRAALGAEVVLLRQQLNVLRRSAPRRLHLTNRDRSVLVWAYRISPSLIKAILVVQPETLVRWHRQGFRAYWRRKSARGAGRPRIDINTRQLIRRMARENPLWGAPRIHGELLMLGISVSEASVSRFMPKRLGPETAVVSLPRTCVDRTPIASGLCRAAIILLGDPSAPHMRINNVFRNPQRWVRIESTNLPMIGEKYGRERHQERKQMPDNARASNTRES